MQRFRNSQRAVKNYMIDILSGFTTLAGRRVDHFLSKQTVIKVVMVTTDSIYKNNVASINRFIIIPRFGRNIMLI